MKSSRSISYNSHKISERSIKKELQTLKNKIIKQRKKFEEFQRLYKIPDQSAYYGSSVQAVNALSTISHAGFSALDQDSQNEFEFTINEETLENIGKPIDCRICLVPTSGSNMISVQTKVMDQMNVLQAIEEVVSLQSSESDCLPKYICIKCFKLLKSMVEFRRLIISSYENFRNGQKNHLTIKMKDSSENQIVIVVVDKENIDEEPIHTNNLQDDIQKIREKIKLGNQNLRKTHERFIQKRTSNLAICKTIRRKIYEAKKKDDNVLELTKTDQTSSVSKTTSQMCNVYEKMSTEEKKYIPHMKMYNKQVSPLVYACPFCHRKFSRKSSFMIHTRVHTGEKPFRCDICNKHYSQSSSLYLHKKRIHDKVIQEICDFCGKKFIDKRLDVHIKMWHTGERPYLCEFCSSTFVCKGSLLRHIQDMHVEKKPCHKCGLLFADVALKKHLVRHQVLEEGLKIVKKKYTCEYCNIVINYESRRQHLEKQHGIKLLGRGDDCKKIPINEATD